MARVTPLAALSLGALAFAGCVHHGPPPDDGSIRAVAYLTDTLGRQVGQVHMIERPGGHGVQLDITIERILTPGLHGIHFHSVGKCDASGVFASAGPHFNPAGRMHGLMSPDGPHAGDLEAITVDEFHQAHFVWLDPRVTLSPGPNSLFDADGSAIVLHALPDDQRTDPSGNSGARVACGVVTHA